MAREAIDLLADTDTLELHGTAWMDLAQVLRLKGAAAEAAAAACEALALFERKDAAVLVAAARDLLAAPRAAAQR